MSLFKGLVKKIKSSETFNYISKLFVSEDKLDWDLIKSKIKDLLLQLDFGLELSQSISNKTIQSISRAESLSPKILKNQLIKSLSEHYLNSTDNTKELLKLQKSECSVFFVIGSNGVGKTSFISKLVYFLKNNYPECKRILLVAGDTFRAGAINQLEIWANKLNVEIKTPNQKEASSALIYRSLQAHSNYDLIICDSSGRQYNKQNLLIELKKQFSIIQKVLNKSPEESFLIVDSTLGTYSHGELLKILDFIPITGIVLTKMDSTTRGGAIYNLKPTFKTPIKFFCHGEKEDEIDVFDINSITAQLIETVFTEDLIKTK